MIDGNASGVLTKSGGPMAITREVKIDVNHSKIPLYQMHLVLMNKVLILK